MKICWHASCIEERWGLDSDKKVCYAHVHTCSHARGIPLDSSLGESAAFAPLRSSLYTKRGTCARVVSMETIEVGTCPDCGHHVAAHDEYGYCDACEDNLDLMPGGAQGAHTYPCESLSRNVDY